MLPLKALLAQHLHFWIMKPKGHTRVCVIASKISMQMSFNLATDVGISGSLRHFRCQHLPLSKTLNVTSGVTLEPAPNILGTEVLTVNDFLKGVPVSLTESGVQAAPVGKPCTGGASPTVLSRWKSSATCWETGSSRVRCHVQVETNLQRLPASVPFVALWQIWPNWIHQNLLTT